MGHPVFTRFPANTLIKGGNLAFRPSDNVSPWTFFGGTWGGGSQTYDATWFTGQMDVAVAMGCNTVRIFGDLELQIAGSLNSATYLSRWDSILTSAAAKGLYAIVTAASVYELNGVASSGVITSTARNLIIDLYNTVRAHTNVIAFDPIQEAGEWVGGTQGNPNGFLHQANITTAQLQTVVSTVYGDLKSQSAATYPLIPVTWSGFGVGVVNILSSAFTCAGQSFFLNALPYMDYVDYHIYYNPTAADFGSAWATVGGKPILVGEFGSPTSTNPSLGDGCDYAGMKRLVENTGIDGAICWALADQSTDPTDCWGCADANGTLRTGRGTVFATVPTDSRKAVSIFAGAGRSARGHA